MSPYEVITCLIFIAEAFASHQTTSNVTELTISNFARLVNDDNVWVVHFYSSKTNKDQSFAKEFATSADALKRVIKFGAIDIKDDAEFAKNLAINIKSLPVVKFYGVSNDGNPKEYTGKKTAKDLTESVLKHISKKVKKRFGNEPAGNSVEEVDDKNFDKIIMNSKEPWLVLFYAPWCGHCKEFEPVWKLVASNLQGKVKFAALDATISKTKAAEYQITQYPTLKLFPFENKLSKHVFDYTQDRNVESITNWILEKLPGPDVVQITTAKKFQKDCMKKSLCVVCALPPIFDCQAECRKKYLSTLKQLGEKHKHQGWGWVWTEAGAQKELEKILNIGGSGYPSLAVLNPVKMRYSVFKGAFTKSKINEFLTQLAKANAVGVERDAAVKIVTVNVWDGEDSANELSDELYLHDPEFTKKDEL